LRLGWLGDRDLAFLAIVIVTVWQLSGYMMIIFIAGLIGIPNDVVEAARIMVRLACAVSCTLPFH